MPRGCSDHPDIVWAERTGYPKWNQPEPNYCDECGRCLEDNEVYEDDAHDYLCAECLKSLHEKTWW